LIALSKNTVTPLKKTRRASRSIFLRVFRGVSGRARRLRPVALRLSADSVDSCVYSALLPISEDSHAVADLSELLLVSESDSHEWA
jgi:hypothetical protein